MAAIATARTSERLVGNERLSRLGLLHEPLGYVDGMSLYEYVRSTPASLADHLGLQATAATQPAAYVSLILIPERVDSMPWQQCDLGGEVNERFEPGCTVFRFAYTTRVIEVSTGCWGWVRPSRSRPRCS